MAVAAVSKRWTITLPPEIRKGLGLESAKHPMMLMELRDGGVFMHPASAVPVRDIPMNQMQEWIETDEADAERFWRNSVKKKRPRALRKRQASQEGL
jgi:bifunctional DNA-binding transcriptional regulator/antitoxin component of YhaV-PrlF toxin-antitoxin module